MKNFDKKFFNVRFRYFRNCFYFFICNIINDIYGMGMMMIIGWTTDTSSVKHFFVLLRSKVSLSRSEKMLWSNLIFVLLKFLEFPCVHDSNLEFNWSKIWSVIHPNFFRMETLVLFHTFKPLDDICAVCPIINI